MNATKYFYAATFPFGRDCTTGEPNKKTGRMSKACKFYAFTSKKERDSFVESNHTAEAFSRRGLRGLSLGSSVENFDFDVRSAEVDADNRD